MSFRRVAPTRIRVAGGVCALALIGGVVAYAVAGGTRGARDVDLLPTTGAYAPLTVAKPHLIRRGSLILNEPDPPNQTWATGTLSSLGGKHRYALSVTNTSNVGYIDSFEWYPPTNVRILRVIGSTEGHCTLSGISGFGGNQFSSVVLYPNILCRDVRLKPPTCTCSGDGGSMTISFVLATSTVLSGSTRVLTATPTLKVIPSYTK